MADKILVTVNGWQVIDDETDREHHYIARAPSCAGGPTDPAADCECRRFASMDEAMDYVMGAVFAPVKEMLRG